MRSATENRPKPSRQPPGETSVAPDGFPQIALPPGGRGLPPDGFPEIANPPSANARCLLLALDRPAV